MSARDDDMITPPDGGESDALALTWTPDGHVDEGTVHAWIDGAFDAQSFATVASHVNACSQCQALVAEARGFIAGASRVVRGLDAVPADVVPHADVARTASRIVAAAADHTRVDLRGARARRAWYTQPVVRAAAALLITVGGGAYVLRGLGDDVTVPVAMDSTSMQLRGPAGAPSPSAPAVAEGKSESVAREAVAGAATQSAPLSAPPAMARNRVPGKATVAEQDAEARSRRAATAQGTVSPTDMAAAARERRADAAEIASTPPVLQGKVAGMTMERNVAGGRASPASALDQRGGGMVAGLVVDPQNVPLEGAGVSIVGTTIGTMTNARGEFSIRTPVDTATLLVRRLGYEPSRLSLNTRADDTARAHVTLALSSQRLASVVTQAAPAPRAFARDESVSLCWEVKIDGQPTASFALPRALRAGDLTSSATESGSWIGWPVAGATAPVVFRRDAGASLNASAQERGLGLVMVLVPSGQWWEGTGTQTRDGVSSTQRVRLVRGSESMCKP